jgi:Rhodopirellula transposase DDE domain
MFCNAGGANSYRHPIFKAEVQKLVNEINMPIVHYLPYTSKWNPIEHRAGHF